MTETEKILETLIGFPTVSRDSNVQLIRFIESFLHSHGIDSRLIFNSEKTKANLYAVFGPGKSGGVMLSGHTDVVPVDGQDWTVEPFRMSAKNGRLYGRGTTDMKGFIASVLAMVPVALKRNLKHPIHLAFSYDEEIGCVGVRSMIDMLAGLDDRPHFCIVGEPTSLEVGVSHKGKTGAICRCHGVEAHSALASSGVNAIYLATEMINGIRIIQQDIENNSERDEEFGVPHSTLHVGTISGGTALNIIPNYCDFKFEFRNLKSDDPAGVLESIRGLARDITAKYQTRFPSVKIEIEIFNEYPALDTDVNEDVVRIVSSLVRKERQVKIDFGTEGGLFQNCLDVPTVICGPGSMQQGHKPDEFIESKELKSCDEFLSNLVDVLCE